MSRHIYELCTLLIDDTYGELTSKRIFEVLLRYGRSSLPAIQNHTGLSYRLLKHGTSVLIQQHLVLWYTPSDNHLTLYEANTTVAYSLVRSGKYIKVAELQAGAFAGKIVSNLLLLGHARVGDLVQAYEAGQSQSVQNHLAATRGSPSNSLPSSFGDSEGHFGSQSATIGLLYGTLRDLLRAELVSRVHTPHFRSDADNRAEAVKVVPEVEAYKAKSTRERQAQHEAAIKRKLKEWRYCNYEEEDDFEDHKKGSKRLHQDSEIRLPEKRQRLCPPLSQELTGASKEVRQPMLQGTDYLDNDLIIRVNHAKFAVLMRNDYLVDLADRSISASTAGVYAQVLRALTPKIHYCREEPEDSDDVDAEADSNSLPQISTNELTDLIKDSSELANALGRSNDGRHDMAEIDHPKRRRKKGAIGEDGGMINGHTSPDGEEAASDSNEEDDDASNISSDPDEVNGEGEFDPNLLLRFPHDPHRDTIRDHLLILTTHPLSFLQHIPKTSYHPERWTIKFPTLMKNVSHHTLFETISSRHGLPAARLTRILFDRGRTDEKILCSTSLLAQKTMRSYLLPLHKAGMIGLQEVPRDGSRNPQRTNFLWFFDPERCKAKILEETYKIMGRCIRRARVEREKVKATIEKASRSDVIGREEDFLSLQELKALNLWKEMDERILGEASKLDDLVACLRDF